MTSPAGPESLWPSQELISDIATLQGYARDLEAFINAEPVLDTEHRRALANQAVGMLDVLAAPLYVGQQVVCEGLWSRPVFDVAGNIIAEHHETGVLKGTSAGFNLQIEEFPADDELGMVSCSRIELAHIIVVGTRASFGKYFKRHDEYWAFAPVASTRLSTLKEYEERQIAESLVKFEPDDALMLGINKVIQADGLDLTALNELFLHAYEQPGFDATEYLTYLNALTGLSGKGVMLRANQAYLELGSGQYRLHKLSESVVEGKFNGFGFTGIVADADEDIESIRLPTGLCVSLEVSAGNELHIFYVPAESIEDYAMEE